MLSKIFQFLRNWTLPLSMILGGVAYPIFKPITFTLPWLVFAMLLVTFCKVPLHDLKLKGVHFWLLLVQIGGSLVAYYAIKPMNILAAEGALVCVICPTATAAAVITDKLGGNAASLTTFTLLSNVGCAIAAPILFPLLHPLGADISYFESFLIIMKKVVPLLICPFLLAMFLRRDTPKIHQRILQYPDLAFYLWAFALVVVMAQTMDTIAHSNEDPTVQIWIAIAALVVCCLQFMIGKLIGSRWNERISGGQSLGQKSTMFAVWMAHVYMTPITAIGAGSYVVWQNIINSWQLWHQRKMEEAGKIDPKQKEGQSAK